MPTFRLTKLSFIFAFLFLVLLTVYFIHFFHPQKNVTIKTHKIIVHSSAVFKPKDISLSPEIDSYLKSINFNGTVLAVKGNRIVMNKGYGFSDMETKTPNNSQTVFYTGSITKVFVAAAIMQLQEKGKLSIQDHVSKYIPDFPKGEQITLYELLTHTSGIQEHSETGEVITPEQLIAKIEKKPLKFQPGTDWLYSDSNYSVLAYILEKVANEPLESYIKINVFEKAGMTHTGYGDSYQKEAYYSSGYKIVNNSLKKTTLPDMSQLFGCGDIYTTPYDMYLFDSALYNGKLLSKKSLVTMFTPVKHNYALGIYHDPGSYSDHGVLPGWNDLNAFSLDGKNYVVLFSNVQNGVKSLGVVEGHIFALLNKRSQIAK